MVEILFQVECLMYVLTVKLAVVLPIRKTLERKTSIPAAGKQ